MIPGEILLHPGHLPALWSPSIQKQRGSTAAGISVSLVDVINRVRVHRLTTKYHTSS